MCDIEYLIPMYEVGILETKKNICPDVIEFFFWTFQYTIRVTLVIKSSMDSIEIWCLKYLITFCILIFKTSHTYYNIKCGQHRYKSRTSLKITFH